MRERKILFGTALVSPFVIGALVASGSIFDGSDRDKSDLEVGEKSPIVRDIGEFVVPTVEAAVPVVDKWENGDRPIAVNIPAIGFDADVQKSKQVPSEIGNGIMTLEVPVAGLSSPERPFTNHIFVFGHSMYNSVWQPFANIENLEIGDEISIINQRGKAFAFKVSEFRLVSPRENDGFIGHEKNLRLTLQTSATDKGWILNRNLILAKVGTNRPRSLEGELAFWVIAILAE